MRETGQEKRAWVICWRWRGAKRGRRELVEISLVLSGGGEKSQGLGATDNWLSLVEAQKRLLRPKRLGSRQHQQFYYGQQSPTRALVAAPDVVGLHFSHEAPGQSSTAYKCDVAYYCRKASQ
jgi:hypothetical protein